MEVLFKILYLVCFVCIGLGLVFVAVTTSSSEEPVKAGLKEVSVGDLIYFAKEDNETVLVYGCYYPAMGETVLFDKPVYNANVELAYYLQQNKPTHFS